MHERQAADLDESHDLGLIDQARHAAVNNAHYTRRLVAILAIYKLIHRLMQSVVKVDQLFLDSLCIGVGRHLSLLKPTFAAALAREDCIEQLATVLHA